MRATWLRAGVAVMVWALGLAPALAQDKAVDKTQVSSSVVELQKRYPAGSINSDEVASEAIADVRKERSNIESRLKSEQRECAKKFLVTHCRDEAKERQRIDRAQLKLIENEAARYKRQQKVIRRDEALAKKREKEDADAGKRAGERAKFEEKESQRAARGDVGAGLSGKAPLTAEERADNVKAYEKKIEEYEANKEKVDERKARNDRKRARKKAAEAREKEKAERAAAQRTKEQ